MLRKLSIALIMSFIYLSSFAQFNIDAVGTNYTQNFNSLTTAGSWTNNTTLTGWYARTTATSSITTFGLNTGSTTTAGLYSYGTTSDPDRALGYATSNAFTGSSGSGVNILGWRLRNNTGAAISSITITYDGEQWRRDNTVAQSLLFSYQVGASVSDLISGTWTSVTALSFESPNNSGTAGALDGNASGNRIANITATINVNIPAGEEIMIRFTDVNDSGNDHALAIDNVVISASSSSSLTNFYLRTATSTGLENVSNWTTDANGGSGTAPSNFTSANQIFNIANNATTTISGNWTVSGTGSKIVVSSGDFTIPAGNTVTGTVDVSGGAELTIENTTLPTFGTLAATSTVQYNNVALTLPASTTYGNLTLSGTGTKTFPGNTTTVTGNLVINNTTIDAPGASPFATILLAGNLTYQGTVTNPIDANSITLQTNGTAAGTQTITANGNTVRYFRIQTTTANTLLMSTTGGSSNIVVGNATSGGIQLLDGSVLNLNGNDLTFLAGGGASLVLNTTGSISGGAQTDLTFARGGTATLGTLRMTSGSNTVRSLTLNHSGSSNTTLTLGNAINVTETVTLTAGTLVSGGNLTLKSTSASATARVEGGTNASITGNVTVERFLPWSSANNNGFRFVGHPLRSNPVINTVTNLPTATNTVIGYNEGQNAYVGIADRSANWPQGIGYGVWTDAANTLSFTGELQLNEVGPISLTNSSQRWHFMANPFPSVLDWNAVSRTDMANAVYIWEKDNSAEGSGAWGSFVDGVSANNGSRYLAPGQGFMVRTNASGSPAITFPAAARSTASNPSFYRQQNVVGDIFRVRVNKVINQTGMETVIRFRNQATAAFDTEYDAAFVTDWMPASPDLYTTDANGNKYSIQALPEITNQPVIVSLGLETFGAGVFSLNFNGSEMQTATQVRLEDQRDGSFRNIQSGQTFTISTGAQDAPGRFRLHFNALSTSVAEAAKTDISIYTHEGVLYVNGAERGDLRITDLMGRMVYQQKAQEFGQPLRPNLAKGAYLVQVYTTAGSQIVKVIF